jgi:hypothetical protein
LAIGALAGVAIGASALSTTAPANAGNTAAATRAECTLALDDYQSEINTANKFDQLAFDYEGEIMPAYKAGQAGSGAQVQAITEKLAMWNVQVSALADEARALNPKLKQAVGTCEMLLKAGG